MAQNLLSIIFFVILLLSAFLIWSAPANRFAQDRPLRNTEYVQLNGDLSPVSYELVSTYEANLKGW
jgi:hypothetical protein